MPCRPLLLHKATLPTSIFPCSVPEHDSTTAGFATTTDSFFEARGRAAVALPTRSLRTASRCRGGTWTSRETRSLPSRGCFKFLRRKALRNWVSRPRLGDLHQRYRSADIGADLAHSATDLLINLARHAGQFVPVGGTRKGVAERPIDPVKHVDRAFLREAKRGFLPRSPCF